MQRTTNPALNDKTFRDFETLSGERMTISGTVNKSFILLMILTVAAYFSWGRVQMGDNAMAVKLLSGGGFGGLILALLTMYKKEWAMVTGPLYAAAQGLLLGGLSAYYERQYPGIVFQAVGLTFGTLFGLLAAYKSKLIAVTDNFRLGVVAATVGIMMIYVVNLLLRLFTSYSIPFVHESGTFGILFSLFVVVVAALNLVLDFDFIEKGAENGAPSFMEWYAAFGLLVTLVWLYLEMLRLLSKLRSRN